MARKPDLSAADWRGRTPRPFVAKLSPNPIAPDSHRRPRDRGRSWGQDASMTRRSELFGHALGRRFLSCQHECQPGTIELRERNPERRARRFCPQIDDRLAIDVINRRLSAVAGAC